MQGQPFAPLGATALLFAGSHFLLSHPLRKLVARALGERVFLLVYSLVAIGLFGWMVVVFVHTPAGPMLWNGYALLPWTLASLLTLIAIALFIGSLSGNPALPQANMAGVSARKPLGVFKITRHPMMWSFAIWALSHVIVAPSLRVLILSGTMAFLALVGAHGQDLRKSALNPREWNVWRKRTSYWPQLSAARELGRQWLSVPLAWLAITWLHLPAGHVPAGLWRLFA
ncbi:MAG: NnrU family protein [Novosphingobium sp.]